MDRVMSFLEQAWRRLVEMANRMQRDVTARFEVAALPLRSYLLSQGRERDQVDDRTQIVSRSPSSTVSAATIVSSLLTVQTSGRGFVDLTAETAGFVKDAGAQEGGDAVHTPYLGSLTIQENADPRCSAI